MMENKRQASGESYKWDKLLEYNGVSLSDKHKYGI